MSTDYNYDEEGQFFPYFIFTIACFLALPLTYSVLSPSKDLENTAPRINSDFKPEEVQIIDSQRKKQKRKEWKIKRIIFASLAWLVIFGMVYLMMVTSTTHRKVWDPYEVLGVSRSADEKEIRSFYRRLSLKSHPDKVRPDSSINQTVESINERWIDLTKAYKALTDDEIRNNYLQYGHPDGKQSFSIGIALPKWIITERNGKYLLMIYTFLLCVLLPYLIGRWWYGTQRVTREKVLVVSAGNLFLEYDSEINENGILRALSNGEEFKSIVNEEKGGHTTSSIEKWLFAQDEGSFLYGSLSANDRNILEKFDDVARRKAFCFLWSYLGRIKLDDHNLTNKKYSVTPIALSLNEAFGTIALAYGFTQPIIATYRISQSIIQAVPPGASPLLQLPHFTPKIVQKIEGTHARCHMTVQDFMCIPPDQRLKLSTSTGLTENQYKSAISIANQIPVFTVEKVFFRVNGERYVTPRSLVQFVIKARVIPPGTSNIPILSDKDLEDVDPLEGALGYVGRKRFVSAPPADRAQPPLAHAPFFIRDHSPRFCILLADSKQKKIVVPPAGFSSLDKPIFDESGNPTLNVQTIKVQFGAPPQAGRYVFVMHVLCDSYLGTDTTMDVTMVVEDESKAESMNEDVGNSREPKQTKKSQKTSDRSKTQKDQEESTGESDSSDSSTSETDSESSTDTDTDTDSDD